MDGMVWNGVAAGWWLLWLADWFGLFSDYKYKYEYE